MKIGYLINGGVDLHGQNSPLLRIRSIIDGLRSAGHQVTFVALDARKVIHAENWSLDAYSKTGLSCTSVFNIVESAIRRIQGIFHFPYFALFDSLRFYEACKKNLRGYDILYEHSGLLTWGDFLAGKRLGLPVVLDIEADYFEEQNYLGTSFQSIQRQYAKIIFCKKLQAATAITVVSQVLKQHLVQKWCVQPEKIFVVPNGVDIDRFKPDCDAYHQARSQLEINYDDVLVTFVGYFFPWHGVENLVEAFRMALDRIGKLKLLLVGDGVLMPKIKEMICQYQLMGSVILTGTANHVDVPGYLNISDICVAPYPELKSELWFSPMKIYEYMSAGKAVIASRAGQITNAIHHEQNGYLVEPGNIQQLAEAIIALATDHEKRTELGEKAREDAVKYYSWQTCVINLERVLLKAQNDVGSE